MKKRVAVLAVVLVSFFAFAGQALADAETTLPRTENACRDANGDVSCQEISCGAGTTPLGLCMENEDGTFDPPSDHPEPLKPLNYCKHEDGTIDMQRDECGPGTTPLPPNTPIVPGPGGTFRLAPPPRNEAKEIDKAYNKSKSQMFDHMGHGLVYYAKIIGIALVVGVLGKLLGQSFWLWAVLGVGLRYLLVALHVIGG